MTREEGERIINRYERLKREYDSYKINKESEVNNLKKIISKLR
jgi:hypothetical protein